MHQEHDRGELGGRVRVRDAAADRAPGADRDVRDQRERLGERRAEPRQIGIAFRVALADAGAHHERSVGVDRPQGGDPADVDEARRAGEAERHQRDEALATGENLGVVTVLGEEVEGLVDGVGRRRSRRVQASRCVILTHGDRQLNR